MKKHFKSYKHQGLPGGANELKSFTEGFIVSSEGQYKYPGMNTMIPNANGRITMSKVGYPVLGIDDLGNSIMMQPGGEYQFPGNDVYEIPMADNGGPKVKQRRGARKNPDGSESTHIMMAEYIPERGWVGFPSLFQDSKPYADDSQNWVDMSEEEDWMKIYEEAEKRGEVYDFGEDKEAALAFGKGSWKDDVLQSPEAWKQEIKRVEREIGNPRGWTIEDYYLLQDKLNAYKDWRERHPEVIDYSNKPNEYVVPLPPHLNADQYTTGGTVSWNFKGKTYSGTLIPGMEDENNRYARTHNGKIKTLPKTKYTTGGSVLTNWNLEQQNKWKGLTETDDEGASIIKGYNDAMGTTYNPSDAWSAITISNAAMAHMGARTGDEARSLGFRPSKSHSGFVRDAFKATSDPTYEFNRYYAQPLNKSGYKIGDILVKGREETKNWKYDDFANAKAGYRSHSDIIVDRGEDEKGEYVILAGGNISNTYKNEKIYTSNLGKKGYKVQLSDQEEGIKMPEESDEADVKEVVKIVEKKPEPTFRDFLNEDDYKTVQQQQEVQQPQPVTIKPVGDPFAIFSAAQASNIPLMQDVQQRMTAAQSFAEDGGFIVELDEEEAKRFAEGGYVLEELQEGGEDGNLITYKNNKNLIDSVANWDMQSDVDISSDYNDQIKARLLTGNYGYNPKTGELVKLGKSQQTKVTDKEALQTKGDLTSTKREDAKQKLMDDYTANRKLVSIDKADEWNPSFVIKDEYGRDINTQDFAGKQVYMTDAEEEAYKKARIGYNAPIMQNKMNNAFRGAASFTPVGLGINAIEGATRLAQDVPELVKDPSLANAGNVLVDALMVSPFVPAAAGKVKPLVNQAVTKLDDATRVMPGAQSMNMGFISDFRSGLDDLKNVANKVKNKVVGTTSQKVVPKSTSTYSGSGAERINPVAANRPFKVTPDKIGQRLGELYRSGKYWDEVGIPGDRLIYDPKMINYKGTYSGRPIVEVTMPDGSKQFFYKSTGFAGKAGSGPGGTTSGQWQVYGGHANNPRIGGDNWFIKNTDYKNYYGSNTYKGIADAMDNQLIKKFDAKDVDELNQMINFQGMNRGLIDDFIPGYNRGGFVLDLDETEAQAYAKNGYIVEELPQAQPGGFLNNAIGFVNPSEIIKRKQEQEEYFRNNPAPLRQGQNLDKYINEVVPIVDSESTKVLRDTTPITKEQILKESKEAGKELSKEIENALYGEEYIDMDFRGDSTINKEYNPLDTYSKYLSSLDESEKRKAANRKSKLVDIYKNANKFAVSSLQKKLISEGYDIGKSGADGIFGKNTEKALLSRLEDKSLDSKVVDKYYGKYTTANAKKVEDLQTELVNAGYLPPDEIDGKFGPKTKKALELYNKSKEPNAFFFSYIPENLKEKQCAKGMCQILEKNKIETEALGVKYRNAWDIKENMDKQGNSTQVYNIYDNPAFDNIKNGRELVNTTKQVKKTDQTTPDMYKPGDIVGIFWPNSSHHNDVLKSKTFNTHVGFVSSIKDGVPYITHNVHGEVRTEPYNNVYTGWIQRPNDDMQFNKEYDVKTKSTTNKNFIKNLERKFERSLSSSEKKTAQNIANRAYTSANQLVKSLNSDVDPEWLEAAVIGITGVESGVGKNAPRTKSQAATGIKGIAYELSGKQDEDISLGVSKIKFSSLDNFAKNYFGIQSEKDLANDDKSVDVTTYNLIKNYDTFKDYAKQYPELLLSEDDIKSMAILAHNRGASKLLTIGRRKGAVSMKDQIKGLRDMARTGATQSDVSSTNYRFIPGVGDEVYNLALDLGLEDLPETYISKVKRYIGDVYGKNLLSERDRTSADSPSRKTAEQTSSRLQNRGYINTPKFELGGSMDIDLTPEEALKYAKMGYIVEEIN